MRVKNENELIDLVMEKNIEIQELKNKIETAKEVIEYLLLYLKIEGYDISESGCETDEYEIYLKAISLIEGGKNERKF